MCVTTYIQNVCKKDNALFLVGIESGNKGTSEDEVQLQVKQQCQCNALLATLDRGLCILSSSVFIQHFCSFQLSQVYSQSVCMYRSGMLVP